MVMLPSSHDENFRSSETDIFHPLRGWAPDQVLEFLDQLTLLLPDDVKYRLKTVMETLPRQGDNMQKVLEVVRGQWQELQCEEELHISIVGLPGSGKTSLTQALSPKLSKKGQSIFHLITIQGLEEFVGYGSLEEIQALQETNCILLVLDGRFEASSSTRRLYKRLQDYGKPLLVVLNKMDMAENPGKVVRSARRVLGTSVFTLSTLKSESLEKLLKAIVASHPKALYSLTKTLPRFRRTICNSIVSQAAFSAGLVAAIPIPVSDFFPISAIQTAMILKIARTFGYSSNRRRARELLPLLAAGTLVREGGNHLIRQFPNKKHLLVVSLAGIWTFLAGQTAIYYFEESFGSSLKTQTDTNQVQVS